MKIDITFTSDLFRSPDCDILQMLPESPVPDLQTLSSFAKNHNTTIITPPFEHCGQRVMACVTPQQTVLQPMCFPDSDGILAGQDVAIVELSWGKLAMCCEADIFQPQYARLAALKGCSLLAVSFPWRDPELLMAGPWSICQANCLPLSLAQPDGGQLILPCPMTQDNSGFGRSSFDTDELPEAYRAFPVFKSLNGNFCRRYREVLGE